MYVLIYPTFAVIYHVPQITIYSRSFGPSVCRYVFICWGIGRDLDYLDLVFAVIYSYVGP